MDLKPGFYWISEGNADPEIASWTEGEWWIVGSEEAVPARQVKVLSERLRLAPRLLSAAA